MSLEELSSVCCQEAYLSSISLNTPSQYKHLKHCAAHKLSTTAKLKFFSAAATQPLELLTSVWSQFTIMFQVSCSIGLEILPGNAGMHSSSQMQYLWVNQELRTVQCMHRT